MVLTLAIMAHATALAGPSPIRPELPPVVRPQGDAVRAAEQVARLQQRCVHGDSLACLLAAERLTRAPAFDAARWRALRVYEVRHQPWEVLAARVTSLETSCEAGDAGACANLALYLDLGAGVPHDDTRAERLRDMAEAQFRHQCALSGELTCEAADRIAEYRASGAVWTPIP